MVAGKTENCRTGAGAAATSDQECIITRVFDAPRDLVFKAWTEPERLMRWWGADGFTTPLCKIDLRPGGVFHLCMRSPEGRELWCKGVYREIVRPARIVFFEFFSDEAGHLLRPAHYGMGADWPAEKLVCVTFAEHEGGTKLTVQQTNLESIAKRSGVLQGWTESFDRLADDLAKIRP
jgi:uncharacterized protein YndB with AHSA1/START domain